MLAPGAAVSVFQDKQAAKDTRATAAADAAADAAASGKEGKVSTGSKEEELARRGKDMKIGNVIVFTATKVYVDHVVAHLNRSGVAAGGIHSDKTQATRDDVLDRFRSGEVRVTSTSTFIYKALIRKDKPIARAFCNHSLISASQILTFHSLKLTFHSLCIALHSCACSSLPTSCRAASTSQNCHTSSILTCRCLRQIMCTA
jgi:hypothetical protein